MLGFTATAADADTDTAARTVVERTTTFNIEDPNFAPVEGAAGTT